MHTLRLAQPKTIKVADKPLALGGQITEHTPKAFEEKFGVPFVDEVRCSAEVFQAVQQSQTELPTSYYFDIPDVEAGVRKLMRQSFEGLVLCDMGQFGYGVFAERDIARGEVVAIYPGQLLTKSELTSSDDYLLPSHVDDLIFSARTFGGMGRFFQHAFIHYPSSIESELSFYKDSEELAAFMARSEQMRRSGISKEQIITMLRHRGGISEQEVRETLEMAAELNRRASPEYDHYQFDSRETESLIARQNLIRVPIMINGIPVVALVSNGIKEHGIAVFSYTWEYWYRSGRQPVVFTRYGEVVHPSLYSLKKNQIHLQLQTARGQSSHHGLDATASSARTDIKNDQRVVMDHADGRTEPVSPYAYREAAVDSELVPSSYRKMPLNSFALALYELVGKENGLADDVEIECYFQTPVQDEQDGQRLKKALEKAEQALAKLPKKGDDNDTQAAQKQRIAIRKELNKAVAAIPDEAYHADVVVRTSAANFARTQGFFSGKLSNPITAHSASHEIVIRDVNTGEHSESMLAFTRSFKT